MPNYRRLAREATQAAARLYNRNPQLYKNLAFAAGKKFIQYAAGPSTPKGQTGSAGRRNLANNQGAPVKKARSGSTASRLESLIGASPRRPPFVSMGMYPTRFTQAKSSGFAKTRSIRPNRHQIAGINYTGEFGGTTADLDMVTIGHSTCPARVMYTQMWHAVVKTLLKRADYDCISMTSGLPEAGTIAVTYKKQVDTSQVVETYTVVQNTTTASDIAAWLGDSGRGWNANGVSDSNNVEFYALHFIVKTPAVGGNYTMKEARLRLDEMSVTLKIKSSLKMQNRSTHTADAHNADTIDQVPLYGKSYEGTGSGARYLNEQGNIKSFQCDINNGVIINSRPLDMKEPPKASEFKGVTRMGKMRIEPGNIKTSVLSQTVTHKIAVWTRKLVPLLYNQFQKATLGRYRFFCMEKILDAEHTDALTIAFEHNLSITTYTKFSSRNGTVQLFESTRNITP